jgi:hypothetical protein
MSDARASMASDRSTTSTLRDAEAEADVFAASPRQSRHTTTTTHARPKGSHSHSGSPASPLSPVHSDEGLGGVSESRTRGGEHFHHHHHHHHQHHYSHYHPCRRRAYESHSGSEAEDEDASDEDEEDEYARRPAVSSRLARALGMAVYLAEWAVVAFAYVEFVSGGVVYSGICRGNYLNGCLAHLISASRVL